MQKNDTADVAGMTDLELENAIRQILAEELDIEPGELSMTADFVEEYDADSLSLITVLARIEKQLGVRVPPSSQADMVDMAGVLDVVRRAANMEREGV